MNIQSIKHRLRAISQLPVGRGGVASYDASDIQVWVTRAGPDCDTDRLSDLDRERINSIFQAFYED